MSDSSSHIGSRIREARRRLGKNRNQMARDLGTSWQHVDRWEKGKTLPTPESLQKLSRYLGVRVDDLLGGGEGPGARDSDPPALKEFLRAYAPRDLAEAELRWLRAAPLPPDATPGRYVDLLHALRSGGTPIVHVGDTEDRQPPAKSGTHARVDRSSLELDVDEG